MKKIDIHCHVAPFPQYQIGIPDTSRTMNATEQLAVHDKLNVDIGVLLTCVSPEGTWGSAAIMPRNSWQTSIRIGLCGSAT